MKLLNSSRMWQGTRLDHLRRNVQALLPPFQPGIRVSSYGKFNGFKLVRLAPPQVLDFDPSVECFQDMSHL